MEAARLAAQQIQQHEEEEDDGNMPMAQFLTPAVAPDLDSSANGSIANKNVNEAWDLYKLKANTQTTFSSDRTTPRKVAGIHEIDVLSATNAKLATLTKQVELLVRTQMQGVNAIQTTIMCENCGANHSTSNCMLLASPE
ncbi:Uncharacterized protein Adt_12660 [Abeliophyllum distichum]|uniref:Uncharacterized protein n=1 Tax=Abeliophyllum distichum TaxID=126358 RepID=A0ABD1URC1_9LAMI